MEKVEIKLEERSKIIKNQRKKLSFYLLTFPQFLQNSTGYNKWQPVFLQDTLQKYRP